MPDASIKDTQIERKNHSTSSEQKTSKCHQHSNPSINEVVPKKDMKDKNEHTSIFFHVIGMDVSVSMLEVAKKKRLPFQKLICQDINHLQDTDFKDNTFDAIIMIGVLEFVKKPHQLFKCIHRLLKSGGWFGLTIPKKISFSAESYLGIKTYKEWVILRELKKKRDV